MINHQSGGKDMPTSRSSVLATHKDKIFSYIEETSLSFGITLGGVMGIDIAAKELARAVEPVAALGALTHGAYIGTLVGMAAAYSLPVLSKVFFHARQKDDFEIATLLETHHDKKFRMAGLASGLIMGIAVTWNAIAASDNKPINIQPLIDGGEQLMAQLGESGFQFGGGYGTHSTASLYTVSPNSFQNPAVQPQ